MAHGKSFSAWIHTASVEATVANTVRDAKTKRTPYIWENFHPHILAARKKRQHKEQVSVKILKSVFIDRMPLGKIMLENELRG